MVYALTWLPGVLRGAGLNVIEVPGWQTRGHGDMGKVAGILCHHTCGPLHGDLADLNVLVKGRPDLAGPLCNLGLGRSGTIWMIAAGRGYHAGAGAWQGITDGNSRLIGIEAENTGESRGARADTWPDVQMEAYAKACAAILLHIKARPIMVAGHKEYARPIGRKDDPSFEMAAFRARIAAIMGQGPAIVASDRKRTGKVNTNALNIRADADSHSRVVASRNKGDAVTILDEKMNGTTRWFLIDNGGWAAARFIDETF